MILVNLEAGEELSSCGFGSLMQFTTERLSLHSCSLCLDLPQFSDAAWRIFNQGTSAFTPSHSHNMLFCSCVKNSHQIVTGLKLLTCSFEKRFCVFMHVWKGEHIYISGNRITSCPLSNRDLTITLYFPIPVLIAKDKPIAVNKCEVKLPGKEKVISPSSCPHLSANLDIFQHRNVKYFLSPFTPQQTNWINLSVNLHKKKR